jgi:branched-chain amino acid transport system substrate-binding protein
LAGGEIETMLATIDAAGKNIQLTGLRTKYNKNNTGTQLFLKKYESKYGETCTVPWMAVTARDSLYLIASIMKDGGYTQNDGDVIRNELSNTKNWNGLSGNITFDQNGDAALEYEIVVIKS